MLLSAACTTDRTRRGYLERMAADLRPPERHVIVVPGFGVTRLYDPLTERYVWGTPRAAVRTLYEDDLDLPRPPATSRDRLVPRGYAGSRGPVNVGWQLTEALQKYGGYVRDESVHPFFYDWRLSARDNAAALARLADRISPDQRVDLVTHSAGALVALTWIKLLGGSDRVERLVMIAPPRRGVVDAFRVFVRPERFVRRILAPDVVATWPAIYELLPDDGRFLVAPDGSRHEFDAWRAQTWQTAAPGLTPDAVHLANARALRDQLAAADFPPGVQQTVIAGDCVPTAMAVLLRDDGSFAFYRDELRDGERSLAETLFEAGDGTVPVSSARAGGDAHLFCDGHQGIATDPNVHRALLRALGRDW